VLVRAGGERATVAVTQAAVWIQREQLTTDAARRQFDGPLNPADVEVAIRLASPELPQGANARGTPAAVGGNVVNGRTDIDVNVNAFRGMVGKMRRQAGANRPGPERPAGKLKNVIGKAVQRVDQVRVAVPAPNADETAADPTAADETDVGEALGLDFFQLRIHGGGGGR
jgi:hypothetical protein